ncbi:HNH endonuclease [Kitasatospora sp. NPDC051853]|uniref:HNH endonuclease n=1 Tax=Kitasatospora sp. NPDC051853 TaxID=3364058 RepID=UPI00378D0ED6
MSSLNDAMDWRNESLGTRVRVALWLREQGVGTTFRKKDIRAAITGTEQVDRRMRDLRPAGWVIRTCRDKPDLAPDELYLETIGHPVWEAEHRAAGLRRISAKTRRLVLERDGSRCRRCGIGAGEPYPEAPSVHARMTMGHVVGHGSGGLSSPENLVTECARCNEAVQEFTGPQLGGGDVWHRITSLPLRSKQDLLAWMVHDARTASEGERVWGLYRQLPAAQREDLKGRLYDLLRPSEEIPDQD